MKNYQTSQIKIRKVNNLNLKEKRTETQQIKKLKIKMVIIIHYKITSLVSMEVIKMEIINKIIITIKLTIIFKIIRKLIILLTHSQICINLMELII
jgi:hypothetical protein